MHIDSSAGGDVNVESSNGSCSAIHGARRRRRTLAPDLRDDVASVVLRELRGTLERNFKANAFGDGSGSGETRKDIDRDKLATFWDDG